MTTSIEATSESLFCDLSLGHLDDAGWLGTLTWRRSADAALKSAGQVGDSARFGKAFQSALPLKKKRHRTEQLRQLEQLWTSESDAPSSETVMELPSLSECLFGKLDVLPAVLFQNVDAVPTRSDLLAGMWILRTRAHELTPDAIASLFRWIVHHSQHSLQQMNGIDTSNGFDELDDIEFQFYAGLICLPLKGGHKLLKTAIKGFSLTLKESTDGDGTPHAQWLPRLESFLTTIARMVLFARLNGDELTNTKTGERLEKLFDRAFSLMVQKHIAFRSQEAGALPSTKRLDLIADAMGIAPRSGQRRLIKKWGDKKPSRRPISIWALPDESHQSDWSEWACLRTGWEGPVDMVHVTHHGSLPQIDALVRDVPLWSGEWGCDVSVNSRPVEWKDSWTCVCWFADHEASYLELKKETVEGVEVTRHLTLVRDEHLMMVTDSVSNPNAATMDCQFSLPMAKGWSEERDTMTREIALVNGKQRVRVYPISQPQYLSVSSNGNVQLQDSMLLMSQTAESGSVHHGAIFDWSPKRRKAPVAWQWLTVAEEGKIQPRSRAVGYRLLVGDQQWMTYHSLEEPAVPRTILGHHTSHETIIARIEEEGEIAPLVEVEG